MRLLFVSVSLLIAIYATYVFAEQIYARDNSLDGYKCDTNDISFTSNARSRLACGNECAISNTCFSWFYAANDRMCYGCSVSYASNNAFPSKTGSKYYKHACESGWVAIHGGCYLIATDIMNFTTAWSYCQQRQSQLLYLETQSEISMITEYLLNGVDTTGVYGYWIAVTDEAEEGVWRRYGTNDLVAIFNWGSSEPYGGTHENFVMLYKRKSFKWNDGRFNTALNPICERN